MFHKLLMIALTVFTFSAATTAQCGSHHRTTKVASSYHHKDIVDVAAGYDALSTLVVAVKTAGLVETLKSDGPFTVFAPVNSAFAKLEDGVVAGLLKPAAKEQLTKILTYHVVAGELTAKDVVAAVKASGGTFTLETVSGDELQVKVVDSAVILIDENGGRSAVRTTDIQAANGVIHSIDSVILPK